MTDQAASPSTELAESCPFLPGLHSARVVRFFEWYAVRKIRRQFHAVHITPDSTKVIDTIKANTGPTLIIMNHSSWWDPLISVFLAGVYLKGRRHSGPMDIEQLKRFRIFRKVGVFGLDPTHPDSARRMQAYLADEFERHPQTLLWMTPQGRFEDIRTPFVLRPGAAAVAAAHPEIKVVCLAIEYAFWQDQSPELFMNLTHCEAERCSTTGWMRAMQTSMRSAQAELAALVQGRDPAAFVRPVARGRVRTSRLYDWLMRLRRQHGSIEVAPPPGKERVR